MNKITNLKTLHAGDIIKSNKAIGVVIDSRLEKKPEKNLIKIQWLGGGCAMMDSNYPPCMEMELVSFDDVIKTS
jgi:hypothetical protein